MAIPQTMESHRGYIAASLYLLAFLLILVPAVETVSNVGAPHLSNLQWRFPSAIFITGALLMPAVGLTLALATAYCLGHRGIQAVLSGVAILGALAVVALAATVVLDGLQLRGTVLANRQQTFDLLFAKTVVIQGAVTLLLSTVGISGLRMLRRAPSTQRAAEAKSGLLPYAGAGAAR